MSNNNHIHFHLENKIPVERVVPLKKFKLGTWTLTSGPNDMVITDKDKPGHTVSMSTLVTVLSTFSLNQSISSLTISSINGATYPPFAPVPASLTLSTIESRDYVSTPIIYGVSSIVSNNITLNFNSNVTNFLSTVSGTYVNRSNANITSGEGIYDSNMNNIDVLFPRTVRITVIGGGGAGAQGVSTTDTGNGFAYGGGGGGGGGRIVYTTLANNYFISYKTNSTIIIYPHEYFPEYSETYSASIVVLSNIYTTNLLTLRARYGNNASFEVGGSGGDASGPPSSVATSGGNGGWGGVNYYGNHNNQGIGNGGKGGGVAGGNGGGVGGAGGGYNLGISQGTSDGQVGTNGATYGDGGGGGGGAYSPYSRGGAGAAGAGGLPLIKFEWL